LIRFSTLQHAYDKHPQAHSLPWAQFLDSLAPYVYRQDKNAGPLFSPATFTNDETGPRKTKEHVEAVHFLALDFDDVSAEKAVEILRSLEPYHALTYTTWKQPQASQSQLMRFRAVLPMSRPCAPQEWPAVYSCAVRDFGASALDTSCSDPNRFYFTPALPEGCSWAAQTWRSPGAGLWDVDAALAKPRAQEPVARAAGPGVDPTPREAVLRLSQRLANSADPKNIRLGTLMRSGLDGHEIANQGGAHQVLRDLAWRLAAAFPTGAPDQIAEHFHASLDFMRAWAKEDPVKHFTDLIVSGQKKVHDDAHQEQAERALGASRNILKAFEGLGQRRGTPYTQAELTEWGDLSSRWILQAGSAIWIFFVGDYVGPFQKEAIGSAVAQWLSPAQSAGVEVYKYDDKGNVRLKDLHELVSQYGRVVTRVEADLAAPRTYLDAARCAVVEAPCRLRELEPAYSPEVDAWLRALAGAKYDRLCDWMACITFLRECTPAVFVKGASGVGKNMLALGLSRLWSTTGPTPMSKALGEFNAQIVNCPLVYADEQIPETFRGEPRTEELRELITTSTFSINQKNRPISHAKGSCRVIIGANNFNAISRKAELTPEDAQALADRFILIDAGTEDRAPAKDFLVSNGGPAFTKDWVEGDKIAQHALWLRDEVLACRRIITRGSRFILPGDAQELVLALQTTSRVPSDLLEWIWQFLQDPARHVGATVGRPLAALVKSGEIWINPRLVLQHWSDYMGSERAPTANAFARTTRGIVMSEREGGRYRIGRGGYGGRYQRIRLDAVRTWLRDVEPGELERLLAVDTETLGVPGQRQPGLN
jgi:hypothetical protein